MAETKKKTVMSNLLLGNLADITRQTTQQAAAPASKQESAPIVSEATDGWSRFTDYAHQYNDVEGKSRGATVWIDEDVKAALEKIKSTGACNVPVRHLVSAAVRTFIEEHKADIKSAMEAQSSSLL